MSFVAILIALLLEQARPVGRSNLVHVGLRAWVSWCGDTFDAGKEHHAWLAWAFAVLLPSSAVLLVYWLLAALAGWPFAVLWNIVVLYFSLGFRQFSHHFTEIRDALDAGDEQRARALLAQWRQIDATGLARSDIVRQVVEHSVLAAHRHVFGVLAWFSILAVLGLGPVGAVLYRLNEFVPRYWAREKAARVRPVSAALQHVASLTWSWLDWLPARVTAVGFAVVGSFEDAIDSWRNYERQGPVTNDGVILASTAGAINIRLGAVAQAPAPSGSMQPEAGIPALPFTSAIGSEAEIGHLRVVVGLVWRTVVMWMVLLALLSLARLLG
ncbi:MAG: CobD/CbiB family protein [Rhodoferax sp.]|nr:CobD/CbiB family protein [Rhodoferax sp.]